MSLTCYECVRGQMQAAPPLKQFTVDELVRDVGFSRRSVKRALNRLHYEGRVHPWHYASPSAYYTWAGGESKIYNPIQFGFETVPFTWGCGGHSSDIEREDGFARLICMGKTGRYVAQVKDDKGNWRSCRKPGAERLSYFKSIAAACRLADETRPFRTGLAEVPRSELKSRVSREGVAEVDAARKRRVRAARKGK